MDLRGFPLTVCQPAILLPLSSNFVSCSLHFLYVAPTSHNHNVTTTSTTRIHEWTRRNVLAKSYHYLVLLKRMAGQIDFKVAAVLPAGGVGQRMGLEMPKQFVDICGRPLICCALDTFESVPWISKVTVPVASEWRLFMNNVEYEVKFQEKLEVVGWQVTEGYPSMIEIIESEGYSKVVLSEGKGTRHQSIFEGIKSLYDFSPDVVIIHDAVRPLIEEATLCSVAIAAKSFGASGMVRPLVSTILVANEEGLLDHSLVRSQCRASEMPQAFQFDVINTAYRKATASDFMYGTECLHLTLEYTGTKAKLLEGPSSLWKVTYQNDLDTLEKILIERSDRDMLVYRCSENVSNIYQDILKTLKSSSHYKVHIIKPFRDVASLRQTELLMVDKKGSALGKILLFFLDGLLDGSEIAQLRSICKEMKLIVIAFVSNDSDLINATKDFVKESRNDSSMLSKVFCVVYQESYVSQVEESVSRNIAGLLRQLIKRESENFHGQIFEF